MRLRKRESIRVAPFNNNLKNSLVMSAGIVSFLIMLVMRIPLTRAIGDAGVGMFAPAFEIFMLVTLFTSYSMSSAMTVLIRYRVRREQHRNARKVFRAALWINLAVGIGMAVVIVAAASVIAQTLVLEELCRKAVIMAAPAIVLAALSGALRGYFHGYGLGVLVAHSQYLEGISMAVCSCILGEMRFSYGTKVSALLQKGAYTYAYSALGAMDGVVLAEAVTLLHLLVMLGIYSGTLRGRMVQDNSRRIELQFTLQKMLLANSIPVAAIAVCTNLFMLIDQRIFNYCMAKQNMEEVRTALWGNFYGKAMVLIGIGAVISCLCIQSYVSKVGNAYEREEYRVMRERLGKAVKRLCIVGFPLTVYVAVLAKALVTTLFTGEEDFVTGLVQKGTLMIVLYGFCFFFGQLMLRIRMTRELLATTAIAFIIHIAAAYILVQKALLGADGIMYSAVLFFAVYVVLNFLLLCRSLKYRQDWLSSVAFPAAAAVVSGLIVLLMDKVLFDAAGGIVTILAGSLVGVFVYIFLLMALRVIGEAELSRMPLGFLFIILGRNIGIL